MKHSNNSERFYATDAGLLRERLAKDTARAILCGGARFEESMRLNRLEKHLARLVKQPLAKVHETILADAKLLVAEEVS